MNTYVFDQGWQQERDRLAGVESLFDNYTTQRLAGLGVSDGWHCPWWPAGPRTGSPGP